jgi:glycosyltransferase involved in cell wall biosynthesis
VKALKASVVIPALHAEGVIARQLACLADQSCTEFEVIIADNGGSPLLAEIADEWSQHLQIRVVNATARPGCGPARNVGVGAAQTDALLFCDADDLVAHEWVEAHLEGLESFDFCTGPKALISEDDLAGKPREALLIDTAASSSPNTMGSHPYASGCNASYRRATLNAVGGFCSHNLRREDVEASWLASGLGYKLGFLPEAKILYVQRDDTQSKMRQSLAWGIGIEALRRQFGSGRAGVAPMSLSAKRVVAGAARGQAGALVILASLAGQMQERAMPGRYFERVRRSAQERTPNPPPNS